MLIDFSLIILSLAGFLISLYFTLVYYRKIPANHFLVPRICRMEESRCQTVLSAPDARVFGAPNFLLGLIYYTLIFLAALLDMVIPFSLVFLFWISVAVVLLGVYLTHSLLFKIKISCPLCFVSHGINAVITVLLAIN
jgi:uncharacterized membrane protein